jgi:hypothetical protein
MRLRDLMIAVLGLAAVYALRDHLGRLATRATGTWVGRP